MKRKLALIAAILAAPTLAQPAPKASPGAAAAPDVPTDIRRVTLIVRSVDRSLALYRDVLGLKVNYDAEVIMSGVALPAGEPGAKARLVLLQSKDPWIGWIGLLEWRDPPLADPGPYAKHLGVGSAVIVTNTDDSKARCAAAAKVPGVTITSPPRLQTYPGRNGEADLHVFGCNLFDPDGTLIELNQLLP